MATNGQHAQRRIRWADVTYVAAVLVAGAGLGTNIIANEAAVSGAHKIPNDLARIGQFGGVAFAVAIVCAAGCALAGEASARRAHRRRW